MNFKILTRTERQQDRKKKRRKDDEHDSEDIQTTYNELWWTSNIELGRGGGTPKVDQTFSNKLSIMGGGTPLWQTKPAKQYLTGSLLWSLVDFGFRNRAQLQRSALHCKFSRVLRGWFHFMSKKGFNSIALAGRNIQSIHGGPTRLTNKTNKRAYLFNVYSKWCITFCLAHALLIALHMRRQLPCACAPYCLDCLIYMNHRHAH